MKSLLCLPGFGTNANILKFQLKQIENTLKDQYNFIYIDPTNELSKQGIENEAMLVVMKMIQPEGIFGNQFEEKIYRWGNFLKSQQTKDVYAKDFQRVHEIIKNNPDIVGLISFSQGGHIINTIAEEIQNNKDSFLVDQIQFVILFSAGSFIPNKDDFANYSLLSTRSLHFSGPRDFLHINSILFSMKYLDPQVIEHDQGHKIPKLSSKEVRQLKAFCSGNSPKL